MESSPSLNHCSNSPINLSSNQRTSWLMLEVQAASLWEAEKLGGFRLFVLFVIKSMHLSVTHIVPFSHTLKLGLR